MAKKSKDTGKPAQDAAVELNEDELDDAQGGIIIINGSSSLTQKVQKVQKVRDLGLSSKTFKV